MNHSRAKNPHHPESALADYLQDLLSPSAGQGIQQEEPRRPAGSASSGPGLSAPALEAVRHGRVGTRAPALDWAEPPLLDPQVFSLPTAAHAEVATREQPAPEPMRRREGRAGQRGPEPILKTAGAAVGSPLPRPPAVKTEAEAPAPADRDSRWIDGRPGWAQSGFDCLLFSVNGLKLAVPLVLLGSVHPLDQALTPLVGRPAWFMGLLGRGGRNTRVVDTARWVMPERYQGASHASYGFVIRLDDSDWGLACDEVAQSFRLEPDQVKWRSEDGRRPWLAGTVKSQMCALLDVGEFARMLARAERTQQLDLDS